MVDINRVIELFSKKAVDYKNDRELDPMSELEESETYKKSLENSTNKMLSSVVTAPESDQAPQYNTLGDAPIEGVSDASTLLHPGQVSAPEVLSVDFGAGAGFNDALTYGSLPDGSKGPLKEYMDIDPESTDRTGDIFSSGGMRPKEATELYRIIDQGRSHRKAQVFIQNAKSLRVVLDESKDKLARGEFKYRCRAFGHEPHTVAFQFLKSPDTTVSSLLTHNVLLGCDCDGFSGWGPRYYAVEKGYMLTEYFHETAESYEHRAPKDYVPGSTREGIGRGLNGTFCKHIYACYEHLVNWSRDNKESVVFDLFANLNDVHEYSSKSEMGIWASKLGLETQTDLSNFFDYGWRDEVRDASGKTKMDIIKEKALKVLSSSASKIDAADAAAKKWYALTAQQKNSFINNHYDSPSLLMYVLFSAFKMVGRSDPSVKNRTIKNIQGVLHLPLKKIPS